ncbi:unnamed protein product [Phytomonas sp. EM1]|nr:unnamed protein product [Phytomonas sp. EM1]|eukprot:CCW59802.1 unnamed protein product [Phytomonas sp. isolate EM1]
MSGENIYNLLSTEDPEVQESNPYTGSHKKHLEEPSKPAYSTFFEKGKNYDGTNVRFFKQRDAVIGRNVGDTIDPKDFLNKGKGTHKVVPPIHKEKIYLKPRLGPEVFPNKSNRQENGVHYSTEHNTPYDDNLLHDKQNNDSKNSLENAYGGNDESAKSGDHILPVIRGDAADTLDTLFKSKKDFVKSNIVASCMVPKRRKDQPQLATDRKDFGKTPKYLSKVKEDIEKEKEHYRLIESYKASRQQQIRNQYVYRLDESERAELVSKLSQMLIEKETALNKVPFLKSSATISKKKSELEKSIKDIEVALQKLKKEAVFVYSSDPAHEQVCKNAAIEEARRFAASI